MRDHFLQRVPLFIIAIVMAIAGALYAPFAPVTHAAGGVMNYAVGGGEVAPWQGESFLGVSTSSLVATDAAVDTLLAPGAAPSNVYQHAREAKQLTVSKSGLATYAPYRVRLHFVDTTSTAPGQRVFTIKVNGKTLQENLDIYKAAGGANKAIVREILVSTDWSPKITITLTASVGNATISGVQYEQYDGRTIAAGRFYVENRNNQRPDTNYSGGKESNLSTAAVDTTTSASNPVAMNIYQGGRFGTFDYTFPGLAPGTDYLVTLHFNESYFTAAGQRIFNVTANGKPLLENFDIFKKAKTIPVKATTGQNVAVTQSFTLQPDANGTVKLSFTPTVDNPKLAGLSITPIAMSTGVFHTGGSRIYDPNGQNFVATGANISGDNFFSMKEYGGALGHSKEAKEWGWKIVRFNVPVYENPPNMLEDMDALIREYTAAGIVVILDSHNIYRGTDLVTKNDAFWTKVAPMYKNNSYVWYAPLNEYPGADIVEATTHLSSIIRNSGANNIIVMSAPVWGQDIGGRPGQWYVDNCKYSYQGSSLTSVVRKFGNTILDTHAYGSYDMITYYQWGHKDGTMINYIRNVQQANMPLVFGEFGYDVFKPTDTREPLYLNNSQAAQSVFSAAMQNGVSIMWWHGNGPSEYALRIKTSPDGKRTMSPFWSSDPLSPPGKKLWDYGHRKWTTGLY